MAEPQENTDELRALLGAVPREQLVEICRKGALDGLQNICRTEMGGRIVAHVVAELFPELSRERVAAVTQQIGFNTIRITCLWKIASIPGPWEATVRCPDRENERALRALKGPAILAFWHFGPVYMMPLGFRRLGITAQIFTRARPHHWTSNTMRLTVREADQTVKATRRALQHLKNGGKVAIAIDGGVGQLGIEIPFFGRRYAVSRGAAALARMTGAPIIPCTMQWESKGWEMAVRIFEPLPRPSTDDAESFERELLISAGRCFENYGRQHPEQFKVEHLKQILDMPKLGA